MHQRHPDDLLTVAEAAKRLNISKRTMDRRISEKKIPTVHIGHAIRLDPADVRAYIERSKKS